MTGSNHLTLAVAGGRKTQSIVDACANDSRRRLVITYTTMGQSEIHGRLAQACGANAPEVMGWYSFLINHIIRPYLPAQYPNRSVEGFNFDYDPGMYATGEQRHFDKDGRLLRKGLSHLAASVADSTSNAPYDRLAHIYDEICIDEVQDLTGWDLEILEGLFGSSLDVELVGDLRQSVFDTNPQDQKYKQYRGLKMIDWFRKQEQQGRLTIRESLENWRCVAEIVDLANSIFPAGLGFGLAVSRQTDTHEHQGIFSIKPEEAEEYVKKYRPLALRWSANSGKALEEVCDFKNMGAVKGISADHVLIFPTKKIRDFLTEGSRIDSHEIMCKFYVATTRARFSFAYVMPSRTSS